MVCSIVRAETDRQLLRQMINYGKQVVRAEIA